jgi:hypothetical protein
VPKRRKSSEPLLAVCSALAPKGIERQLEGLGKQCPAAVAKGRVRRVGAGEREIFGSEAPEKGVRPIVLAKMPGGEMQGQWQAAERLRQNGPALLARAFRAQLSSKLLQCSRCVEGTEDDLGPTGAGAEPAQPSADHQCAARQ